MAARNGLMILLSILSFSAVSQLSGVQVQAQSTAPTSSMAPASSTDCQTLELNNLVACLTYVEKGSNLTVPDTGCCSGFSTVVDTNPICLCPLLSETTEPITGTEIDHTRALMLPTVCKVQTPSPTICSLVGSPVSAPGPSAPDCQTLELINLATCLQYVEQGGNVTVPDTGCCSGLKTVVDTNPVCLCSLLTETTDPLTGTKLDHKKVLKLPTVCKVKTPPVSLCSLVNKAGSPAGSPQSGPAPSEGSPGFVGASPVESVPATASPASAPSGADSSFGASTIEFLVSLSLAALAIF